MPDRNKLEAMRKAGWRKVRSCVTCLWAPAKVRNSGAWGDCTHKDASYTHGKHGTRRIPCHPGAVCRRYTEIEDTDGLSVLDFHVDPNRLTWRDVYERLKEWGVCPRCWEKGLQEVRRMINPQLDSVSLIGVNEDGTPQMGIAGKHDGYVNVLHCLKCKHDIKEPKDAQSENPQAGGIQGG